MAGWATLALLLSTAWLLPWYAIWALPLAALADSRRLRVATLVFCAYAILIHLPLADPLLSPARHIAHGKRVARPLRAAGAGATAAAASTSIPPSERRAARPRRQRRIRRSPGRARHRARSRRARRRGADGAGVGRPGGET